MAQRAFWEGYMKLSLVTRRVAMTCHLATPSCDPRWL